MGSTMHCTMGLLHLENEEQAREIKNRLDGAIDSITTNQCNDHDGKCKLGFLAAIKQVEFWKDENDNGMIVATMDPGFTSLGNIRSAMEEVLGSAITEKQPWKGHITLARKTEQQLTLSTLAKEEKLQLDLHFLCSELN